MYSSTLNDQVFYLRAFGEKRGYCDCLRRLSVLPCNSSYTVGDTDLKLWESIDIYSRMYTTLSEFLSDPKGWGLGLGVGL